MACVRYRCVEGLRERGVIAAKEADYVGGVEFGDQGGGYERFPVDVGMAVGGRWVVDFEGEVCEGVGVCVNIS